MVWTTLAVQMTNQIIKITRTMNSKTFNYITHFKSRLPHPGYITLNLVGCSNLCPISHTKTSDKECDPKYYITPLPRNQQWFNLSYGVGRLLSINTESHKQIYASFPCLAYSDMSAFQYHCSWRRKPQTILHKLNTASILKSQLLCQRVEWDVREEKDEEEEE